MNIQILEALGLAEHIKLVEQGMCPACGNLVIVEDLKNEISIAEHKISGLCQICQDDIFGLPLTEEDLERMSQNEHGA